MYAYRNLTTFVPNTRYSTRTPMCHHTLQYYHCMYAFCRHVLCIFQLGCLFHELNKPNVSTHKLPQRVCAWFVFPLVILCENDPTAKAMRFPEFQCWDFYLGHSQQHFVRTLLALLLHRIQENMCVCIALVVYAYVSMIILSTKQNTKCVTFTRFSVLLDYAAACEVLVFILFYFIV